MRKIVFMSIFIMGLGVCQALLCAEPQKQTIRYRLGKVMVSASPLRQGGSGANTASTVSIITSEDMEVAQKTEIKEILQGAPGIAVEQNGGLGGAAACFIRGANSGHTLVTMDGIVLNDPISADRTSHLGDIMLPGVEEIEIIRGPQSAQYGSDAMGGVINLFTKEPQGYPSVEWSSELGAHDTQKEYGFLGGRSGVFRYAASLLNVKTHGFSKASQGQEEDAYKNMTIHAKMGVDLYEGCQVTGVFHSLSGHTEIDGGKFLDDPNATSDIKQYAAKIECVQQLTLWWDHTISFQFLNIKRDDLDLPDAMNQDEYSVGRYRADNLECAWRHVWTWPIYSLPWLSNVKTHAGLTYRKERGSAVYRTDSQYGSFTDEMGTKDASNRGYYVQQECSIVKYFQLFGGVRLDDHEQFGMHATYRAASGVRIPKINTELKASLATGFKAPTLYQLYSSYGKSDLSPERSIGYDIGVLQKWEREKLSVEVTYFHNTFKDMINVIEISPSVWKYQNVDRAKTRGVECGVKYVPITFFECGATYTYWHTRDEETGIQLARRPKDQIGITSRLILYRILSLRFLGRYRGDTWDDAQNTHKVSHFFVADAVASCDLDNHIQIYVKLNNVFDRRYEEIQGYQTERRSWYGGIKGQF